MIAYLESFTYLYWLVLGGVLLILELIGTAGFLFWIGISALCTGLVLFIIPSLQWESQWLLFSALCLVVSVGWGMYLRKRPLHSENPKLNRRGEQYVGQVFTLVDKIENHRGVIQVGDSRWTVLCDEDLPAKTSVRVIAVDGVRLKVVAASSS